MARRERLLREHVLEDDERQLRHHRETNRFLFESDPRTGCSSQPYLSRKAGADGRTNRSDLIFSLKGLHSKALVPRQFMQDVRRRRYRIRTIEQRTIGEL